MAEKLATDWAFPGGPHGARALAQDGVLPSGWCVLGGPNWSANDSADPRPTHPQPGKLPKTVVWRLSTMTGGIKYPEDTARKV